MRVVDYENRCGHSGDHDDDDDDAAATRILGKVWADLDWHLVQVH